MDFFLKTRSRDPPLYREELLTIHSTHVNLNYKHLYKNIYFKDFLQQKKLNWAFKR